MEFFVIFVSLLFAPKVSSVSYKFEILISPGFQVWEIEEHEVPVEVPYRKFMEFGFEKAFIVIYKPFNLEVDVFYWLGTNTSMEKRKHTAYYAGLLVIQLSDEELRVRISSISREVDSIESKAFCQHFNLTPTYFQKLYRVSGSVGQHVMQVPCSYQKLNKNDNFVLDCKDGIFIWNSFGTNKEKIKMAYVLAKRIKIIQNNRTYKIFTLCRGTNKEKEVIEHFKAGFFGNIPDALNAFPKEKSTESDDELKQIRQEEVVLKEYSMVSDTVFEKLINIRPLKLSMFEDEKAYILKVLHNRNTFVYLGVNANPKVIQKAMIKAEKSFTDKSEYDSLFLEVAWKKVTIIYGNQKLPVHFLVNFDEEIDKLLLEKETCN